MPCARVACPSMANESMIIRPTPRNPPRQSPWARRGVGFTGFMALGVYGLLRLTLTGSAGVALTAALIGIGTVGAFAVVGVPAINALGTRNATIFLDIGTIGKTGLLGRKELYERSELARIVLRPVATGGAVTAYTFFVSQSGRCLFKVASRQWSLTQLHELATRCAVPLAGSWDDPVISPAQARREMPGAFSPLAR